MQPSHLFLFLFLPLLLSSMWADPEGSPWVPRGSQPHVLLWAPSSSPSFFGELHLQEGVSDTTENFTTNNSVRPCAFGVRSITHGKEGLISEVGCVALLTLSGSPHAWIKCPFPSSMSSAPEPQVLQYLLTGLFANMSSAEVSAMGVLGDVPIFALDPANWSVHFHWPWVSQAAAKGDTEKLMSQRQIALRNVIRYVHEQVRQAGMDYPLVVQMRAGCELYPNTTSRGFLYVGEGGKDLVAFEVNEQRWEMQQPSQLAEQVSRDLNKEKSVNVLLDQLLSIVCQWQIPTLNRYGKEALERQERPVATVFARTPSPQQLLLVCHVTAFYPRPISVAWLRGGQEVPPGPELNTGPILPNADLTYQLRSVLAVAPQDGHSYACRVRHRSLGTRSLLIPWENHSRAPAALIPIAVLLLGATASAGGFWWWKHRKGNDATWEIQELTS